MNRRTLVTGYSRMQIALNRGIAALIILPVTGVATWFGGSSLADTIHTSLKIPLLLLFAPHVLAALFQQFVLKTGLMRRMTRAQS